jgi:hypothetical protein
MGDLEGDGWRAVDVPYAINVLAMPVMPTRVDLAAVEANLDAAWLAAMLTDSRSPTSNCACLDEGSAGCVVDKSRLRVSSTCDRGPAGLRSRRPGCRLVAAALEDSADVARRRVHVRSGSAS